MTTTKIIDEDLNTIYNSDVNWARFFNKTILISGANGFLPAYILESLLFLNQIDVNNNVKVFALVRNIEKAEKRFKKYINDPNLKFIVQDVADPINIENKVDYIIHAASQASPKYFGVDPVGTLKANVLGTINLLNFAMQNKLDSFLYFSSGEVYGELDENQIPIKEDSFGYLDPTNVRSCYAESKRMGENICISYFHQYNVPVKIVRPFHTYGPGMSLDDGRVFADFVANVINKQDIIMESDGRAIRPFCYLTDATLGFINILISGINGQAYNMGNPFEERSIIELAQIIASIYPELKIKVIKKLPESISNHYLKSPIYRNSPNIEKLIRLGWIPKVSTFDGFKRTIDSFLEN